VPVNVGLAQLSDHFLLSTVVFYALGMLAFAGDFAYGRTARRPPAAQSGAAEAATVESVPAADAARVAVPAGVTASAAGGADAAPPPAPLSADGTAATVAGQAAGAAKTVASSRWRAGGAPAGPWVRVALVFTAIGLVTHILGILTRGLSEHRVPWGNMYEFVTAITCAAVIAFLLMCVRFRIYSVGLFFLAPIVLALSCPPCTPTGSGSTSPR